MPFYSSNNLRLHYVSRNTEGKRSPRSIIFQHGIGGDVRQPSRFLAPARTGLPATAFDIFHADFRGHGLSDLGPLDGLSIAALGQDLAALLDHLELQNAIIGGISMGAAAALRFAVGNPERCRALVLCRPAWAAGPMNIHAGQACALAAGLLAADDWRSSALAALQQNAILPSLEGLRPNPANRIPEGADDTVTVLHDFLRKQLESVLSRPSSRDFAIARLRRLPISRGLNDDGACLAVLRCPTLILASRGDPTHPFELAQDLAQLLPNCRLVQIAPKSRLDETPHLEEVDRIVGEFLCSAGQEAL